MKISKIQATSRISTKVGETYYTFEYSEERLIEDGDDVNDERVNLWDACHSEVDTQLQNVLNLYKK